MHVGRPEYDTGCSAEYQYHSLPYSLETGCEEAEEVMSGCVLFIWAQPCQGPNASDPRGGKAFLGSGLEWQSLPLIQVQHEFFQTIDQCGQKLATVPLLTSVHSLSDLYMCLSFL